MAKQGDIIVIQDFRGLNVEQNPQNIDDSEAQIATNVIVKDGSIQVRGGYESYVDASATRTGGIPMMTPFYKRDLTKQLVYANDDDYFYVTPSSQAPQNVGDYGTAVDNPTAYQYKDVLVFGTGLAGNTPKKWDGSSLTDVTTKADGTNDLRFFTQFNSNGGVRFLVGAGNGRDNATHNITTLYHTTDPDDWSTGGNRQIGPSDGTDITGLIQQDQLVVYKEKSKFYLDVFYEENAGTFALRTFGEDRSSGSPNHESLLAMDGDVISITDRFKSIEGYGREGTAQGNSRPKQFGTNINPIIKALTWQKGTIEKARSINYDRLMLYAAPFNSATYNNIVLVGHPDQPTQNGQPSWTTWNMTAGSFALFQDNDNADQLYIGDSLQAQIYQYNPSVYSDNGSGYRRHWKSKMFSLFAKPDYDTAKYVVIEGYMRTITEFTLKVTCDGKSQSYIIDADQLIAGGGVSGAAIGDRVIGDEVIGGNSVESDKFKYLAIAELPNSNRYCKNIEVEIFNEKAGHYWSVDYLSINEPMNLENIPDEHKNLRST